MNEKMSASNWWLAILGWLDKTEHYLYRECYFFDDEIEREDCIAIYDKAEELVDEACELFANFEYVLNGFPTVNHEDEYTKSIWDVYCHLLTFRTEMEDIVLKDITIRFED